MDAERRYCLGCFRTLDEIASWGSMDEPGRKAAIARLPERRQAFTIRVEEE